MRGMRPDAPPPENEHPTMKIIADSAIPFLRGVLEPYAEVEYLRPTPSRCARAPGATRRSSPAPACA